MKSIINKKVLILLSFFLPFIFTSYSQKDSFGKPEFDDFKIENQTPNGTENAIILLKQGNIYYDVVNGKFKIIYEIQQKVKILTEEGVSWGTVDIFYNKGE